MGASTSSCVNAAVGAYSQEELAAFLVKLPADCRQRLLVVVREQAAGGSVHKDKQVAEATQAPLTNEQTESLRSQMQVLADESTGAVKQSALENLFKNLGFDFKCQELEALLAAAAGPNGRAATPTEFVDYLLA
uniref:Uncharacterized protein n=1 Tax=Pyrodinium bahamense TaxID=73915 RepID=A0A7S0F8L6_9DINO